MATCNIYEHCGDCGQALDWEMEVEDEEDDT